MPAGQPAPTKTATPSTQQAQPIVPVKCALAGQVQLSTVTSQHAQDRTPRANRTEYDETEYHASGRLQR